MVEITLKREVDHPGQQQIIELGINQRHGRQADRGSGQGEVDVGGGAVAAAGAEALQNRLLHLGMGRQHRLDDA